MRRRWWATPHARSLFWQVAVLVAVGAFVAIVAMQVARNLEWRGIASGFDYLGRQAGFQIADGPLSYSPRDSYARALAVGLVNTARVAVLGIAGATALGLVIALARLSTLRLVAVAAQVYIELMRNTPLLLQLLFWYSLTQALPGPREALQPVPGVLLCFRGLFLPWPVWHDGGVALARPAVIGFGVEGGAAISPEFATLLIGLTTCTAAFVAEIVRAGIVSVPHSQTETAAALGLSRGRTMRLVVMPQAVPVIVPPLTSQFLNLMKNSSLAVAIGYPDLISVTNTTLNQTGQAIEALALAMGCYLGISLLISLAMSLYERRVSRRAGRS